MNILQKKTKELIFFPALILFVASFNLQGQVKMYEEKWVLPTYSVEAPDKNPMFFKGESYQGASKYIYPYAMNDVISNEKTDQAWKALILENEDGSKTIWIGETEPRHRMRWSIGITAYPEKSYYSAEVKIHNPTPFTHTMLFWANVERE